MPRNKNDSFEALRDALIIRKKIVGVMRVLMRQSRKRLEVLSDKSVIDGSEETKNAIRDEYFNQWLIEHDCLTLHAKGAELTGNLRTANTIFPKYMAEFTQRRVLMDMALGACNALQDELQYIAEAVYADKNKFTALVLEIEELFKKIKSVRQADNRFLKELKDNPQKA